MLSEILAHLHSCHLEFLLEDLRGRRPFGMESELEVSDDLIDDFMILDKGDHFHLSAALRTDQWIDFKIQRVRYREGYDKEVFMKKGKVYKVPVSSMTTSNYFAPGHRIRIEVSSSNFPRYERNLNTGGNNYDEKEPVVAHNKVHHSDVYPSQIRVSIVQRSKASPRFENPK